MVYVRIVCMILFVCPLFAANIEFKQWRKEMHTQLVQNLCAPNYYFKSCFDVTDKECKATVSSVFESCFPAKSSTKIINLQQHGPRLAYANGVCLGKKIELLWKPKKNYSNKACDHVAAWL